MTIYVLAPTRDIAREQMDIRGVKNYRYVGGPLTLQGIDEAEVYILPQWELTREITEVMTIKAQIKRLALDTRNRIVFIDNL